MSAASVLACGPLILHINRRELHYGSEVAYLARQECALLAALMRRSGEVVQTDHLLAAMYPNPDEEPGDASGVAKVIVSRIRRVIEKLGVAIEIRAVVGEGYVLDGPRRVVRTYTPSEAAVADAAVEKHRTCLQGA